MGKTPREQEQSTLTRTSGLGPTPGRKWGLCLGNVLRLGLHLTHQGTQWSCLKAWSRALLLQLLSSGEHRTAQCGDHKHHGPPPTLSSQSGDMKHWPVLTQGLPPQLLEDC